MKRRRKAQSILEYTLLLGAIIAVIVSVLLGSNGIQGKTTSVYNAAGGAIETITNKMTNGVFGF